MHQFSQTGADPAATLRQFGGGLGFFAAFLVAKSVTVVSHPHNAPCNIWEWSADNARSFTVKALNSGRSLSTWVGPAPGIFL